MFSPYPKLINLYNYLLNQTQFSPLPHFLTSYSRT